ncbi:RAD protein [Plasmodium cynomolgi strain B]|uniref:RAD protein n=1 Tax=Plasmodium cynomolgi (strain B) TaxID=1120755 RepID=K6UT74_PLACD|nr:RAD protein [Plasmodium cynomolgi strain B]GAB65275.1 RAD protein [Plasmodium cynomolgi strain B]
MLTAPRVVFSVFTLMNVVLLNGDLPSGSALSLGGAGLKAPRQLSEVTQDSGAHATSNDVSNSSDDSDCSEEKQSEVPTEATSSSVKKEQVKKTQQDDEEDDDDDDDDDDDEEEEEEEDESNDDDDDDDDDEDDDEDGGIDISGILKEHMFVVPKEKVELLLEECNRIQKSDYERALDNLFGELHDFSIQCRLPKEVKMSLWYECLDDIADDLKEIDEYFDDIYEYNMNADSVVTVSFVYSLTEFLNKWTNTIEQIEKKWCALFAKRAMDYREAVEESMLGKAATESTHEGEVGTSSGNAGTSSGNAGTSSGNAGTSSGNAGTSSGNAGTSSGNVETKDAQKEGIDSQEDTDSQEEVTDSQEDTDSQEE